MAVKIQIRRDIASNWTSVNPTLSAGELGFETDTGKLKVGTGSATWTALPYAGMTPTEVSAAITAAIGGVVDLSPSTLDTLNELAAAINDDPNFFNTVSTALGTKQDKVTGVSDTEIGYLDGVTSAIQTQINSKANSADIAELAQDAVGNSVGTGLSYNDTTGAISVDRTATDPWYDPAGSAATAETDAKAYTDDLIGDATVDGTTGDTVTDRIASAAATALDDAEGYADEAVTTHSSLTLGVRGISDTAELETQTGSQTKATAAQTAAEDYTNTQISDHASSTSSHGVDEIVGATEAQTLTNKTMGDDLLMDGNQLTGLGEPTQSDHAATKGYVDAVAEGLHIRPAVLAATTENITATYNNGTNGVDATLTIPATATLTIDGLSVGWSVWRWNFS